MDDALCWATIECSKDAPTARNPRRRISNIYDIALDASKVWGLRFSCPCCGEVLYVELADKGDIPGELRKEIIDEKRAETRAHFKTFIGVTIFLLAAMAARLFLSDVAKVAPMAFSVLAAFAFLIWLPYFIFMVWLSKLSSSGVRILRDFERKNPGEIIILVEAGRSECSHALLDFPETEMEDGASGYRVAEQI